MTASACEAPPMGHNNPPAPTPYEAFRDHIADLAFEARNYLDGAPIETEEQAAAVSRILDDARKARRDADAQRKLEAKPFDEGKAAVQALWTPLTDEKNGQCALVIATAKQALAPWLVKIEEEQRREAEVARLEAERLAQVAAEAHAQAAGNLSATEDAERILKAAGAAERHAKQAEKARPLAKGGERAIGLVDVFTPVLIDSCAALKHYREHQPAALKEWLLHQAVADVRAGKRSIPGFEITSERKAR
jgi:hypothetical protein